MKRVNKYKVCLYRYLLFFACLEINYEIYHIMTFFYSRLVNFISFTGYLQALPRESYHHDNQGEEDPVLKYCTNRISGPSHSSTDERSYLEVTTTTRQLDNISCYFWKLNSEQVYLNENIANSTNVNRFMTS